ncbi:MAG: hypothetical protein K2X29_06045 [Candidatus Obscuribacterales bacterium]|nr:hypothetical protein [Candidatus Obscuribacterales bacterium]
MNKENIYILGSRFYRLQSRNEDLLNLLHKLLPRYDAHEQDQPIKDPETIDLDGPLAIRGLDEHLFAEEDPTIALVYLLDRALAEHAGYLWIDASALLTPQGKLVLISGPSHSGKTTLTLAAALAHNWKILAEDIVLIDLETGMLAPFARPLSLRPDTAEKIRNATGMDPGCFILDGWLTAQEWYSLKPVPAKFDIGIDLAVTQKDSTTSLNTATASSGEFIRNLITHSNALRYDEGVNRLSQAFKSAGLYLLSEGTPSERIETLMRLSGC